MQYETKTKYTQINTNKSTYSEMGPVWQNLIQRTVRTAHLSVLMCKCSSIYNTAQNSSDNLPSYFQTNIRAQMLSIEKEGQMFTVTPNNSLTAEFNKV